MSKLSKLSRTLLSNFFMAKLLALEETEERYGVFSKQMQIDSLENEINSFITSNPRSRFDIQTRDQETNDLTTLTLYNCSEEDCFNHFTIELDEEWTGCLIEQYDVSETEKIKIKFIEV